MKKMPVKFILSVLIVNMCLFSAVSVVSAEESEENFTPLTQEEIDQAVVTCTTENLSIQPFVDVPVDHPNRVAICVLKELGIVKGYGGPEVAIDDREFFPDRDLMRVEALKIVIRGLVKHLQFVPDSEVGFHDISKLAWYMYYLRIGQALNIIGGYPDGSFQPAKPITRDQASKIVISTYYAPNADNILSTFASEELVPTIYSDTDQDQWYSKFVRFVKRYSLLDADLSGNFNPSNSISRAETCEMIYRLLTSDEAPRRNEIQLKNNTFMPSTFRVIAGNTVTWVNNDTVDHELSSDLFDEPLPVGASFSYTFEEEGTYEYKCDIHPEMEGTIIVK